MSLDSDLDYRPSTSRRHTAYRKIKAIGTELSEMGRCTPCRKANTPCVVLKGYSKCARCMRANAKRKCDGNFSELEFDSLEQQKLFLKGQAAQKRAEVGRLAAAAAEAYAALARAQQEEVQIQSQLDGYTETQSRMLRRELESLDALDESEEGAIVGVSLDDDFFTNDLWAPAFAPVEAGSPQSPRSAR